MFLPRTHSWLRMAEMGRSECARAANLRPLDSSPLEATPDNVRVDSETSHLIVGYGSGALAVIDSATRSDGTDAAVAEPGQVSSSPLGACRRAHRVFLLLRASSSFLD